MAVLDTQLDQHARTIIQDRLFHKIQRLLDLMEVKTTATQVQADRGEAELLQLQLASLSLFTQVLAGNLPTRNDEETLNWAPLYEKLLDISFECKKLAGINDQDNSQFLDIKAVEDEISEIQAVLNDCRRNLVAIRN